MRHRVYGSKLGRNTTERTALFKSLVHALLIHGTIITSESKAKAIKGLVDKIINLAKGKYTQHLLGRYINDRALQERLIKDIVPKVSGRTSGYTSIIKIGSRVGDNSKMVRMSIIGAEELEPIKKEEKVKIQNAKIKSTSKNSKVPEKKEEVKKTVKVVKPVRRVAKKK